MKRSHSARLNRFWDYPGWAVATNGLLVAAVLGDATGGSGLVAAPLYLPGVFLAGFWGGIGPGLAMALASVLAGNLVATLQPPAEPPVVRAASDLVFLGVALVLGQLGAFLRRDYQRQARAAQTGRALLRFAQATGDPARLPFLLKAMVDVGPGLLGCHYGLACVLREVGTGAGGRPGPPRFVPEQQTSGAPFALSEIHLPASQEPLSRLVSTREPVTVTDETPEGRATLAAARLRPLRRVLVAPAVSWGKVVGCLLFGDRQSARPFTPEEIEVGTTLAAQMAVALESAASFDALLDHAAESTRLLQLSAALNSRLELGAILREVAEGAAAIAHAGVASVGLVSGQQVLFRERWNNGQWQAAPHARPLPEVIAAAEGHAATPGYLTFLIRDPHGEPLGALELYEPSRRPLPQSVERLLRVFANQAAIAIQNGRLYESLRQQHLRLQELEKLREDLTHMIVHDLRSPLTAILGSLQTIEEGLLGEAPPAIAELNRIALRSARTLLGLVNDLLDISKLESGTMRLDRVVVRPERLAAAAVEPLEPLLCERGLTLVRDFPPGLPAVAADEDLATRVLANLVGNAIKFTPRGGTITVGARAEGNAVAFQVSDTGIGIPPEHQATIFEKFGQVRTPGSNRTRSTGLGLTFCKMAVEAHGGTIRVESQPGKGSTFHFTLPRAVEAEPVPLLQPSAS